MHTEGCMVFGVILCDVTKLMLSANNNRMRICFLSNSIKYSCFLGNVNNINKKSFGRTSRLFPAKTT